jgi:hypothetical protein
MAAKQICPTCGYKIERKAKTQEESKKGQSKKDDPVMANFWTKIIKWDFAAPVAEKTDKEKPVVLS